MSQTQRSIGNAVGGALLRGLNRGVQALGQRVNGLFSRSGSNQDNNRRNNSNRNTGTNGVPVLPGGTFFPIIFPFGRRRSNSSSPQARGNGTIGPYVGPNLPRYYPSVRRKRQSFGGGRGYGGSFSGGGAWRR